ncbi:MAG TPA: LuxR C-terminal-related transcriptional regulator [Marmoricola sp.]|nr:LuxR C-terminal-related transcriptional regulator [Marmoricola sp.]
MTETIESVAAAVPSAVDGALPPVPGWVVPRPGLVSRLDAGLAGPLTLVTSPTGWGKTLGVASWARGPSAPRGLVWLDAGTAAAHPDLFWELLCDALLEAGETSLVPIPSLGTPEPSRSQALALLGARLRRTGPRVLVLDDYPTGETAALGRDLEIVLHHARGRLHVVLVSHAEPDLPVQRHRIADELTTITVDDLAMDRTEIVGVLAAHGVDYSEPTARAVQRHTMGWACGVRLAALALREQPVVEDAMVAARDAMDRFLGSEVLARLTAPQHDLIVRASPAGEVTPELATDLVGPSADTLLTPALGCEGFVDLRRDRSFRCHPLLRSAAAAELRDARPEVRREAVRRTARWHLDQARPDAALEVALAGEDWAWAARTMVGSHVVPALLAGATSTTVDAAMAVPEVRAAQPLLEAAQLVHAGLLDAAEGTLRRIDRRRASDTTGAAELAEAFVHLAAARTRGDTHRGLPLAKRARDLIARLGLTQQRDLLSTIEACAGALLLCRGDLDRAAVVLGRGHALAATGVSTAALDCLGQLALLEASRGDLRLAERHAGEVLKHARGSDEGAAQAHLALAWVHLERAEHVPARQHLDRAAPVPMAGPWVAAMHQVGEARWLVATGQPEAAVRSLAVVAPGSDPGATTTPWTKGLLAVATANALVASGEPQRALEVLAGAAGGPRVECALVVARVLVDRGDLARAQATMAPLLAELPRSSLGSQVECGLLMARVAHLDGRAERARELVDRALRQAESAKSCRPVVQEAGWLVDLVEHDTALRRAHGGFLVGLRTPTSAPPVRYEPSGDPATVYVETLTVREAQVLGLLAEMCSTQEIADELFLSVNTVKTYVRGILRKLYVNRRVDAVRRGRELGLC